MFLVIFTALAGMVNRTYHESVLQAQDETAFQIAEAGLNYGRWRLAHEPEDFSEETRDVTDPLADSLGEYTVTFDPPIDGTSTVIITASGTTAAQPARSVTLRARYGRPSIAQFATLFNSDAWIGGTVSGPMHANGGVRMDGVSDSLVTSAQESYVCQPFHGCATEVKDGVWGSGAIEELWEYPASSIDYTGITDDLLEMKTVAEAASTYYGPSGSFGYEILFNADNTMTVSEVTSRAQSYWSWHVTDGWRYTSHDIGASTVLETVAVPSNGIVFVEDNLWVSGDIRDRVTVAAGVFPDVPATNVEIILNGNVSYDGVYDGTRSFGAVAQKNVIIPLSAAPETMQMDGAFIAQKGSFHRRYYAAGYVPPEHVYKTALHRYGMVATNQVATTGYVSGGSLLSGYASGSVTYDSRLYFGPPPYFPASGQFEFISWEEEQ